MEEFVLTNGWIKYESTLFTLSEAEKIYLSLLNTIDWNQGKIILFGKTYSTPRLEAFYSENSKNYAYSGQKMKSNSFTPLLMEIKSKVEEASGKTFNSVLVNYYRDGNDSNGWHADNEKELGKNPLISSVSFGASRRFDLKHIITNEKISFQLNSGSLLIMGGEMQHFWKHQIAKSKKIKSGRINLTFRTII